MQRLDPWTVGDPHVTVVDIDDESLRRIGQWPWSRRELARLTRALQDRGAVSIGFDFVFAEPDRSSPANVLRHWEPTLAATGPARDTARLPDFDAEFAQALGRGRSVLGFGLLARDTAAAPVVTAGFATIGGDPAATVQNFAGAVSNLRSLETSAAGAGSFSLTAEHDQVVRNLPMLLAFRGKLVPSLALEALRVGADEDTIKVRGEHSGSVPTGYTIRIGERDFPVGVDGTLLLHHGPISPGSLLPAWQLISPDSLDAATRTRLGETVKGRIVLVGTSAVGLSDLRATPVNPLTPGVSLHARALEQILAGHFLARPRWLPGAEVTAAIVLALAAIGLASVAGLGMVLVFLAVVEGLVVGLTVFAFRSYGLLVDPVLVGLAVLASGIAAAFARYLLIERDAARMRSAFAHYLSPNMVEVLARDPDRLTLGGEEREMTFLFTDLEGFTAATEHAAPRDIVAWLNTYLDGLCTIAMDHGGTVDKIVGDAVHVMFNAPLDQPDHAERAVRCALAIDAFAQDLRGRETGVALGVTRIGVNSGSCVVGNFGGRRRFDYTAHGDAINTAARLESANKALGTRICISRATVERTSGLAFVPVATLSLKGKARGVDVFVPTTDLWAEPYKGAFARFIAGEEKAALEILDLADANPVEPVLALHARRIRAGLRTVALAA